MSDKATEICILFGKRGCGKSFLVKSRINEWKRVIVIDPCHEYTVQKNVETFAEFGKFIKNYRYHGKWTLGYSIEEEDTGKVFDYIARIVYELGDVTLIIDELSIFVTPNSYPAPLRKLVRLSRHKNVNIIGITQRATSVPRDFRGLATKIITFRQTEPNDLDYLQDLFNLTDEEKHQIYTLKDYHYFSKGDGEGAKINPPCPAPSKSPITLVE